MTTKPYSCEAGAPSHDGRSFSQLIIIRNNVVATVSGGEKNLVEIIAKAAVAALNKAVGS